MFLEIYHLTGSKDVPAASQRTDPNHTASKISSNPMISDHGVVEKSSGGYQSLHAVQRVRLLSQNYTVGPFQIFHHLFIPEYRRETQHILESGCVLLVPAVRG